MSGINIQYDRVYVKHTVYDVPLGKTEKEIENNAEYYEWRV
jgi:hypothetical protein